MALEAARNYCIVGCVETSGQSDTHGCPGGHEMVLPTVLMLALTRGRHPPPALGQQAGFDSGDAAACDTFVRLLEILRRQLAHQIHVLVEAVAGKDLAHREMLPAPYVSALMDQCIERARDITDGGARYDFTSIDVRGLATLVDSLLAIRTFVFERRELTLRDYLRTLERDFAGQEALRQRIIRQAPKYGRGDPDADGVALRILEWMSAEAAKYRNVRGGRFRLCYYSYGNHVIDGMLLGATPDGRRRGQPISNGASPSNLIEPSAGPTGPMRTVARFPPRHISSGVALNQRFHPRFIQTDRGLESFQRMIRAYFELGGMHIQPNVVSADTLREAQAAPDRYRDLIVKVSGYSAYFCDLGRSIQQDIIDRAEFGG
jgi:formate C-acetyltransferase